MVIVEPHCIDGAGSPVGQDRSPSDEFVSFVEKIEYGRSQLMRMIRRASGAALEGHGPLHCQGAGMVSIA